ncbi:MAG: HAMP domain-containing sensor histidine kinase [Synergistaceae bacterium]|nr:HAMP domain-containing sensor histidine kinase [Synergistaceae bacterium]
MKRWKERFFFQGMPVPLPLLLIFFLAVLLPSIALSFLALRAADREGVYAERRLEETLLAEANLAASRTNSMLKDIETELETEARSLAPSAGALRDWEEENPLVAVSFFLRGGELILPPHSPAEKNTFLRDFAPFLLDEKTLPVYDSIAAVYRKEMGRARLPVEGESLLRAEKKNTSFEGMKEETPPKAPAPEGPADSAGGEEALSVSKGLSSSPLPGRERQLAESSIAEDPVLREKVFQKAQDEGFDVLQRNVTLREKSARSRKGTDEERSGTVVRERSFSDLAGESRRGLLPLLSGETLQLLFWTALPDGGFAGCTLRSEPLRDRMADVLPELLTSVRILTLLDEGGEPLVKPGRTPEPDWRRPYVAREISPLLPRWEAAVWLVDPDLATSRARSVSRTVWALVAVLFAVIAAGGAAILWILSGEMRSARKKTTLLANVSHELKTPLTSLRLFAEMLLAGKPRDEERRKEYLRTMVSETERLSRLVEGVLAFSKKGRDAPPAMEPLDLGQLAQETLSQLEPNLLNAGFAVEFRKQDDLPVRGDAEALRQVLMNLLSNAEKYSTDRREISIGARREKGFALVEVADRGMGVDPENAENIFREFFRGEDSLTSPKSGTGLGLSIARNIARHHEGDILYAPRPGGGSVFSLRLPLDKSEKERSS